MMMMMMMIMMIMIMIMVVHNSVLLSLTLMDQVMKAPGWTNLFSIYSQHSHTGSSKIKIQIFWQGNSFKKALLIVFFRPFIGTHSLKCYDELNIKISQLQLSDSLYPPPFTSSPNKWLKSKSNKKQLNTQLQVSDSLYPPPFTSSPLHLSVTEGDTVRLPCIVSRWFGLNKGNCNFCHIFYLPICYDNSF